MTDQSTHACAVCPKAIAHGKLMCWAHWKLVPTEQQQAVYRTWRRWAGSDRRGALATSARQQYFVARDAAIASVHTALGTTQGEAQ